MIRISLYVTAPPFMHVRRLGEGRPPLGSILLADLAERPATAEELRSLFALAPWCPVCVLLHSSAERRRVPRSPRMCSVSSLEGGGGASAVEVRQADVTSAASLDAALAGMDTLDIVFNCAGIIQRGAEHDIEVFEKVLAVNLTGTMRVCTATRERSLDCAEMPWQDTDSSRRDGVFALLVPGPPLRSVAALAETRIAAAVAPSGNDMKPPF